MSSSSNLILLLGVDLNQFNTCFIERKSEDEWKPYKLKILEENCDVSELSSTLQRSRSVVIQNIALAALKNYFKSGGTVLYLGNSGGGSSQCRAAPKALCKAFGLPQKWHYCAYSKEEYELTYTAREYISPYEIVDQQYGKCNLLSVPVQDRWMVPKTVSLHEYIENHAGLLDGEEPDEAWKVNAQKAKDGYVQYCESLYQKCPLAVHKNQTNDGKLVYMGFVNGDGNIPMIVKSILTGEKINMEYPGSGSGERKR